MAIRLLFYNWEVFMDERNQKINCTVGSCKYNNSNHNSCELKQIEVKACPGCSNGTAKDESMCGSYVCNN